MTCELFRRKKTQKCGEKKKANQLLLKNEGSSSNSKWLTDELFRRKKPAFKNSSFAYDWMNDQWTFPREKNKILTFGRNLAQQTEKSLLSDNWNNFYLSSFSYIFYRDFFVLLKGPQRGSLACGPTRPWCSTPYPGLYWFSDFLKCPVLSSYLWDF